MRLCETCNNFLIRVSELYYSQYERSNFKDQPLKLLNIRTKTVFALHAKQVFPFIAYKNQFELVN